MFQDRKDKENRPTGRQLAAISAVLLLPLSLSTLKAADIPSLFQDAKMSANQLKLDAVQMESYTRSKMNWQSHSSQISRIKEHINRAGEIVSKLDEARGSAEPWHQTSIDRITPVLKELASNTESIIDHLNKTPNHLMNVTYKEYLTYNAELAGELSKLVGDAVDYDATKTKIESLHDKLQKLEL
jgi:hypothetical protein